MWKLQKLQRGHLGCAVEEGTVPASSTVNVKLGSVPAKLCALAIYELADH